jgi:hypothetical protein
VVAVARLWNHLAALGPGVFVLIIAIVAGVISLVILFFLVQPSARATRYDPYG